jgi:hypothetical protein
MKGRLLLASTLFLFAQMPTMQAQESLDLANNMRAVSDEETQHALARHRIGAYRIFPRHAQQHDHRSPDSQKA